MPEADPHQLEHAVHRTLLAGLVVSALLLAAGLAIMLVQGHAQASGHVTFVKLVQKAGHFDGQAVTTLGLLALMITPILRVLVLLVGWTVQRSWRFAGVALAVLVLLCISLALGAR